MVRESHNKFSIPSGERAIFDVKENIDNVLLASPKAKYPKKVLGSAVGFIQNSIVIAFGIKYPTSPGISK